MSSKNIFQTELSHIMGLYVETTVREMERLLDECAAVLENEENSLLKREMERVNTTNTMKFASIMEVLSEGLMEKISLLMMVDETEVKTVEKTGGGGESCGEDGRFSRELATQKVAVEATTKMTLSVTDDVSSSESDHQEEDLDPLSLPSSDEECLVEVDPSQHADPSASDPDKQGPARDGEDVQCGDSGPLTCSHCGKCFRKKGFLTRHIQSCKKPYSCSPSRKGFDLAKQLEVHSVKPRIENTFSCNDCSAVFHRKCTLQSHLKGHLMEETVTCTVCERKFLGEKRLELHKCNGRKIFSCSSCPEILKTREGLSYREETLSEERKYSCETCSKTFLTTVSLKTHMMSHKEKDHRCTVCSQHFSHAPALRKHMLVTHPGEMPEKHCICSVCGRCFTKRNNLYKHMRTHKEERPFSCNICDKKFNSSGNLSRHNRTHTGQKLYSCDLCDKSFTQSGTLKTHKLNAHTEGEEKPSFKCEICGDVCSSRYTLKNHMVTHTGKKPYHCSVCGKGFFSNNLLKVHIHIHTGEKPFECDQCGKRFSQKSHLKYHERVHSGVKAFVCGVCGKAYANRQNLKLHKCSISAKL
ncbi:oocyte zinc finger protein XlCOF6 isoform X1 [Oncorhynchus kisutch]|uniref:oocyte zinc finger protein XlCOF6 isoform X1 n=1 Tax=Oncorhynchus kisutch TaxID=8019 RepID=UPI00099FF001|nr:oocyte zinc finger protein XlCOF6 isoform X1 [Oncorhynchus kisutch]